MKVIMIILLLTLSAAPQTQTTGRIAGTVKDQNGAVVVGANIVISNQATGEQRITTTDTAGDFAFAFLSPGVYHVRARADGFNAFNSEEITVGIAETTTINAVLNVAGVVTDPVTVESSAPLVKTDGPTLTSAFDSRAVSELPLSTRNFTQLIGLTPGASAYLADERVGGRNSQNVSINGARVSQNNIQINGVDANAVFSFRPIPNPAPESIAEFKIQTSVFDATYGRSGGGSAQVVTRSGTNEFHGALYAYFRDTALAANNPFLKAVRLPRPVLERNVYGGTLGGALRANRAFFFVSFQATRERNGASLLNSLSTNVLIAPGLTDDRSPAALQAAFPGITIHDTARTLLNTRLPNGQFLIPTPQTAGGRYFGSAISRFREEQFNANFDYRFNQKNLLSAKTFFSDAPETLARGGNVNVPGFPIENAARNLLVSIQDVHSFSANVVNEARIGWNFLRFSNTTAQPFLDSQFNITRPTAAAYPGMPIIRINQAAGGISFGTSPLSDGHGSIQTASLADTISFMRRSHFVRAGLELRYYANNLSFPLQTRGNIIFAAFSDSRPNTSSFLTGSTQSATISNGINDRALRAADYNFFVQDDWKFSPRLTLNLGLRYELDLPPYDTRGRLATFDPSLYRPLSDSIQINGGIVQAGNPAAGYDLSDETIPNAGKRIVKSVDPNNFAPRVGFAFSPFKGNNFALRGGYGIFYSRAAFAYLFGNIFHPPFYSQIQRVSANFNNPFPTNLPAQSEFPRLVPNAPLFGNGFDRNIRTPYIQQFNGSAQIALSADMKLEAAYVGSRGVNLFRQVAINQARLDATGNSPSLTNLQSRVPFRGVALGSGYILDQTTAQSVYHSMQLSLTRRFSGGLQFLAAYTFAKSIDNASGMGGGAGTDGLLRVAQNNDSDVIIGNQLDNRANRGLSNFDRRHRFVASILWELPPPVFAKHSKAGQFFFGGWQFAGIVTAMSGLPVDVVDSGAATFFFGANGGGARPNFAPGISPTANVPNGYYFNPFAFARPVVPANQPIPSSGGTAIAGESGTDFGNVGRNILRGPNQFNTDFSVIKRFRFDEAKNIEFRAEFFNLFNNVNFANPISNLAAVPAALIDATSGRIRNDYTGDFGRIISTSNNPRIIQLALKLNF